LLDIRFKDSHIDTLDTAGPFLFSNLGQKKLAYDNETCQSVAEPLLALHEVKFVDDFQSSADRHGRFLRKTGHESDLQYCVVASPRGRLQLVVVTLAEGKQEFNVSTWDRMMLYPFWEAPTAGG